MAIVFDVFELEFDFPLEDLTLRLKTTVEQLNAGSVYRIHSFEYVPYGNIITESQVCSLEDIEIQCINKNQLEYWVHKDSGKETALSKLVGNAIDLYLETRFERFARTGKAV